MLIAKWKGFNGVQEEGFTGYQATDSVYCYIEIFDAQISPEEGRKILDTIITSLEEKRPGSLASFEETVTESLKQDSLPLDFSLALGYRVESVLYLKTIGSGSVSIKRGSHHATIIHGTNVASGYIHEGDAVVFSTDYFLKNMKGEEHLRKILHSKNQLDELEERMKVFYEGRKEGGGVLLTVFLPEVTERSEEVTYAMPRPADAVISAPLPRRRLQINFNMPNVGGLVQKWGKKKIMGAVIIVFILAALLFNMKRLSGTKQQAAQESKLETIRTRIEKGATSWSEDGGDMQQALGEVIELRQNLAEVEKTDKKVTPAEVSSVRKELDAYEAKILKRQVVKGVEFYDLSVEEKGAQGSRMALEEDTVAILNRQGRVYVLSLANKSFTKHVFTEAANAGLVGYYNGNIYLFRQGAGIYKTDDEDKIKRIVENDTGWGNVVDMQVYNGNIYLLDSGKENIFKYLVAQDGYSDTIPYFKSGIPSLKQGKSFAIDVAIYIGLQDSILKYLSGDRQDFNPAFPESDILLSKIFTSPETDNIYGIDKAKGIAYVWDKEGAYVKQIQSSALVKCDDVVVYKETAYVLKGPKILTVGL